MNNYAMWTCQNCGRKQPANLMSQRTVSGVRGQFRSRKSVTPLTFLGAILGSRKASGAIESWMFTTSNRRGTGTYSKTVKLCSICSLTPGGSNFFGNFFKYLFFPIWAPFWLLKVIIRFIITLFKVLLSFAQYIRKNGWDARFISLVVATFASIFGVAKFGTNKALTIGKKYSYKRSLNNLSANEVLEEVFRSNEFEEIVNYVLMLKVAGIDGNFSKDEKLFLRATLDISPKSSALSEFISNNEDLLNPLINLVPKHVKSDTKFIQSIVCNLFAISEQDGEVDKLEIGIIQNISTKIGMDAEDFEKVKKETYSRVIKSGKRFYTGNIKEIISEAIESSKSAVS